MPARRTLMDRWVRRLMALMVAWVCSPQTNAQEGTVDPAAMAAFQELVATHRARPGLKVTTSIEIVIEQNEVQSEPARMQAEFLLGPNRQGIVKLQGFVLYLADGHITAIHEGTDDAYFTTADGEAPCTR